MNDCLNSKQQPRLQYYEFRMGCVRSRRSWSTRGRMRQPIDSKNAALHHAQRTGVSVSQWEHLV